MTRRSLCGTIGHIMRVDDISPRVVVWFLSVILLFVAFYLSLMRVDRYLHDRAIDACAEAARFNRQEGSANVSYPIDSFYKDCLLKKGL